MPRRANCPGQEAAVANLEAQRTDETIPQLEARIDRLDRAIQDRRNKRSNLKEKIAGLRSHVEALEGAGLDEAIQQKARELEFCEEERRRSEREVQVLGLLVSKLRAAEHEAKERYLSPVLKRVRPYLQLLFPGAEITIDENLHIVGVVREAGYEEAFHHLSMGTQEQIAVLIRLAFAEMLVEQGHPATVILDDALVFSDDRRMNRMFDILNMAARNVRWLFLRAGSNCSKSLVAASCRCCAEAAKNWYRHESERGAVMRISSVRIENFRGYLDPTPLSVGAFTSIVGRNDVGKSTLLEALEVFFNGGKTDSDDAHIRARGQPTRISCLFENLPAGVVLDARAPTPLADEYLLNADGFLEIVKEYDLGASRITEKVFARANHPTAEGAADLLQLNNTKLKARARELGVDLAGVDQRVNSQIRSAIWRHLDDLALGVSLIPLNDEDAKKVWTLLQKDMPTFALFQADRPSRDDDSEVTSPFDAAIKDAVKVLEPQLDQIKAEVKQKVEEVARRTLAKLREMDATLADDLRTVFKTEPKWAGFKLSLTDHDDVPINKRGSGVRRLILLNFFRAEAERRQQAANSPGIIYAVEEPESSQHPINQKMLINALLELSDAGNTQVLITTHVPGIAALVPPESIRYVHHDNNRHPRVIENDEDVLRLVADQLGVLPDKRVRLLLYVEGPNDVAFLEHISRLTDDIDLATDPRVAFVLSGGGNLKHWVNRRYLQGLGIPEIHIYDRDSDHGYQGQVDIVNGRGNGDWATLTSKREIENYLHSDTIRGALGVTVAFGDDDDVPMIVARAVHEASESPRQWDEVDDDGRGKKASSAKRRLCAEAAAHMTSEQLDERDTRGEMRGWLARIAAAVA